MSATPLRDEIHRVFGPHALEWGLFYVNDPALRFELSDGDGYIRDVHASGIDRRCCSLYDATRVAAMAYLASPDDVDVDSLARRFVQAAATYHGTTG